MGLVRLRIREFAAEKGWTIKEVAERLELVAAQGLCSISWFGKR